MSVGVNNAEDEKVAICEASSDREESVGQRATTKATTAEARSRRPHGDCTGDNLRDYTCTPFARPREFCTSFSEEAGGSRRKMRDRERQSERKKRKKREIGRQTDEIRAETDRSKSP